MLPRPVPPEAVRQVDRTIQGPGARDSISSPHGVTIASNVNGTFHMFQAVRAHWQQHPPPNSRLINTTAAFICGDSPTHPS